jgi:hypothetical protein
MSSPPGEPAASAYLERLIEKTLEELERRRAEDRRERSEWASVAHEVWARGRLTGALEVWVALGAIDVSGERLWLERFSRLLRDRGVS